MRTGVQPDPFDPPTVAHLAIAHTALLHYRLDRVIWTVSRRPLGKNDGRTDVDDRLTVLHSVAADHRWPAVRQPGIMPG
jgi:nicotinic acid mononucleotide adenylyltransferase